jgi:hypothetical protein
MSLGNTEMPLYRPSQGRSSDSTASRAYFHPIELVELLDDEPFGLEWVKPGAAASAAKALEPANKVNGTVGSWR